MPDFKVSGDGWAVRRDTSSITANRKIKKENKELKDQIQALAERLAKIEEEVSGDNK